MKGLCFWILLSLTPLYGVEALRVLLPEGEFWSGEAIPIAVELRALGSFSGTAYIDTPELAQSQWTRLGNPVISSERVSEGEVFVQRHDYLFVTQQEGELVIPELTARFRVRSSDGTITEQEGRSSSGTLIVKRPPGVQPGQFVVSVRDYRIRQSWSSDEKDVELGSIVTRTIQQEVDGMSAMFLAPVPQVAPEGVRIYSPEQDVADQQNRGDLKGTRKDTLRYRMEAGGKVLLPPLQFRVWDPEKEELIVHRLEGLELRVKAPPKPLTGQGSWLRSLLWLSVCAGAGFVLWQQRSCFVKRIPPRVSLPPLNPGAGDDVP